jgi:hypothetical protein
MIRAKPLFASIRLRIYSDWSPDNHDGKLRSSNEGCDNKGSMQAQIRLSTGRGNLLARRHPAVGLGVASYNLAAVWRTHSRVSMASAEAVYFRRAFAIHMPDGCCFNPESWESK